MIQIQLICGITNPVNAFPGGGGGDDGKGHKEDFFWGGAHSVFFLDQGPAYTGLLSLFKCTDLYAYDL